MLFFTKNVMTKNLIFNNFKFSNFHWLIVYSIFLLTVKLLLLPYVQANNSDGICRVYLSLKMADSFFLIKSYNWPPLFFYLMGAALKIYHNPFITPLIVNIMLSIIMLFPLYFLMKRLFNDYTALLLCIIFSLSPIVFQLSLLSMSEIPSVFFIVLSASLLAKGLIDKSNVYIILAGLIFSIAGGFRYDSWFIAPLVAIIIAYRFSFKEALLFFIPALLFPIYWLLSNYFTTGNMFASFTWAVDATRTNKIDSFDAFLRRTWWFPLSLIFAFGPIGFYSFIKEIYKLIKNRNYHKTSFLFFILFVIVYLIFTINCYRGSLLMQHRFTLTLYLLSFPFLGYYFKNKVKNKFKMMLLFSISAFFLAFVYSSKGARPIPRLHNKEASIIADIIHKNISSDSGLLVDFIDWETSYYVPFMSELSQDNCLIIDQNSNMEFLKKDIEFLFINHSEGCILYYNKGKLVNESSIQGNTLTFNKINVQIKISTLYNHKGVIVYKYHL